MHLFGRIEYNAYWLTSDIATVWNGNGSGLWGLAEAIKPLIDSGLHYNEIKIEHDGLRFRFPELTYRNTAFQHSNDITQPILFGRSTQSIYFHTHPSARALPEYLLDGVNYLVPPTRSEALYTPDVSSSSVLLLSESITSVQIWLSINAIEQSWTNQKEQDRQIVLKYPSYHRHLLFLVRSFSYVSIMALNSGLPAGLLAMST